MDADMQITADDLGVAEENPPMLVPENGPSEPLPVLAQPDPVWEKNRRLNNPLLEDAFDFEHDNVLDTSGKSDTEQSRKPRLNRITLQIGANKVRLKIVHDPAKAQIQNIIPSQMEQEFEDGSSATFRCKTCLKPFSNRIMLVKHEALHRETKVFQCTYCAKAFSNRNGLIMHERVHTGEKPFQCPICTKCFARQTNYNIHMKLHASGRRYFCQNCGKWFRDETDMLHHQSSCGMEGPGSSVHCLPEKPLRYRCSFCDKLFHHRRDKHIHERTHTGERPYTCGYCGKGFTQSQALTIHIRTHTGERPFPCDTCGLEFRGSSALRKHKFLRHNMLHTSYNGNVAPIMLASNEPQQILAVDANTYFA